MRRYLHRYYDFIALLPLLALALVFFAQPTAQAVSAQQPWTVLSTQEPRTPVIAMGWVVSADVFRAAGPRYTLRVPARKTDGSRWPVLDINRDIAIIIGGHGLNARVVSRCVAAAPVNCTPYTPRTGQTEGDTRYTLDAPADLPILVEAILDQPKPTSWWEYGKLPGEQP